MTDESLYKAIELTANMIRILEPNHDVLFLVEHLKALIVEQRIRFN